MPGSSNPRRMLAQPAPPNPQTLIEQPFQRGRIIFVQSQNKVYTLFNDGLSPAWIGFDNRYDSATDKELEERFVPPPGFYQPLRVIGFVWRGNDVVRNRLGLGTQEEFGYDGFIQTVTTPGGADLYVNSADGTVLQLLPEGESWQLITPP